MTYFLAASKTTFVPSEFVLSKRSSIPAAKLSPKEQSNQSGRKIARVTE